MSQQITPLQASPSLRLVCTESGPVTHSIRLEVTTPGTYDIVYMVDPGGERLDQVPDDAVEMPGVGFAWLERVPASPG